MGPLRKSVLLTVSEVEDANGNCDASVEVAIYRAAVGVLVDVNAVGLVHEVSMPVVPPETEEEPPNVDVATYSYSPFCPPTSTLP
jgi:hypothetical protein